MWTLHPWRSFRKMSVQIMYNLLASGFYLRTCVSLHGRTFKIVQAAFEIKKLSTLLLSTPLASFAAAAHRNCPTTFHNGSFIKVFPAEPVTTSLRTNEKPRIWQTGWSSTCSSQKVFLSSSHPLRNFFWALSKGRFSSLSLFKEFLDRTSWMTHERPLFGLILRCTTSPSSWVALSGCWFFHDICWFCRVDDVP